MIQKKDDSKHSESMHGKKTEEPYCYEMREEAKLYTNYQKMDIKKINLYI